MANVKISDLITVSPSKDDLVLLSKDGVTRNAKVSEVRGVVNDLTTGGADKALSAEQGKILYQQIKNIGNTGTIYGIRYNNDTDTVTRIGQSMGLVANANGGTNDFNNIMPWAGMRRCNLADNLIVNAYYGDIGYKEDGSNGQVMVEVPAFYYKRVQVDTNIIDTYISMSPNNGFKLHPWFYNADRTTRTKAYISAYEGSIYDTTSSATEINTLTVNSSVVAEGNILITLDDVLFTIPILLTDNTADLVATKIRNTTYSGWTTSGTGAIVIFTCNTTGSKNTATFNTNGTGVTATIVKTTTGKGGYTTMDAPIADFAISTGGKLSSVANVKPCSGVSQNLTIVNTRILATNRGNGWQQLHFNAVSAIQMLLTVEYASLNSQTAIGQGVVNLPDVPNTANNSILTGGTSMLGNKSGKAIGTDGLVSVSYRGIENFWGNIWNWVDGFNINNGFAYISNMNGNFASDTFTRNYVNVGELSHVNGYMSKSLLNSNLDYGFIPAEALGTSSSKYSDYYYQNGVGAFVARLGGRWSDGANAGAFYWSLSNGSAGRGRSIGGRLCA